MADAPAVRPGSLALVTDHLVLALKVDPARPRPSFYLSWYAVDWSPTAGGGNLAFLIAEPDPDHRVPALDLVLTDNPELDLALRSRLAPRYWPLADPAQAARSAAFWRDPIRDGRLRAGLRAGSLEVTATWDELGPPIVAAGPVGSPPWESTTVLIEAAAGSISVGANPVPGRPFPNDVWVSWFGRPLTSALLALGEVFVRPD